MKAVDIMERRGQYGAGGVANQNDDGDDSYEEDMTKSILQRQQTAKLMGYNIANTLQMNDQFKGKFINRAPDKMINFLQGHIILAYNSLISYTDVSSFINDKNNAGKNIEIEEDKITFVDLQHNFKVVAIQDLGSGAGLNLFVFEDTREHHILFLRGSFHPNKQNP